MAIAKNLFGERYYSVNSELTDSSLLMRRIVSASNSAVLN
jgi:hypothetical protein